LPSVTHLLGAALSTAAESLEAAKVTTR